jgi:hypothetical protein
MEKGANGLTRRARGSGAVQGMSLTGICKSDLDLPPSPTSLSALRIAYTAVKVLTMICHGVKLPGKDENRLMLWVGIEDVRRRLFKARIQRMRGPCASPHVIFHSQKKMTRKTWGRMDE